MDTHYIISTLITLAGFCVAWWVNNIWQMVQKQQEQLAALSLKLAESYVSKAEHSSTVARLFTKLDEIQKEIQLLYKEKV